jgi:hypothetical protein
MVVQFVPTCRRWALLCIVPFVVGACSAGGELPQVTTRYAPLHPGNETPVTFRITAEDPEGIKSIELYLYEYALLEEDGDRVTVARENGQWGEAHTWTYPSLPTYPSPPLSVTESHTHEGFPEASYIRYLVRATNADGDSQSEEWVFAAGDWPFGDDPIPILGNGPPGKRIDLCFVAQEDYKDSAAMLGDLEGLIFDGYHINNAIRGPNRKYWQFHYSPNTGRISDHMDQVMEIPDSVGDSGYIDHVAIIHTADIEDWAYMGNFGTEPQNIGTAVHESAHAAFGLKDEYGGFSLNTSTDPHHNVYDSRQAAEDYNESNGWPPGDVEEIRDGWWRPEPSTLDCIMLDDRDEEMPDFARTCLARALWTYSQLEVQ